MLDVISETHFQELELPCSHLTSQPQRSIAHRSLSPCCWHRGQFQHSWKVCRLLGKSSAAETGPGASSTARCSQ